MPDTSRAARLLWSMSLQNARRENWLLEGQRLEYGRKSSDFQSRKALIFNGNWLDGADLR